MHYQFSNDKVLVISKDKQNKNGLSSVLALMQDLVALHEKIEACAEAQDSPEDQQAVLGFKQDIDSMYDKLVNLAQGGLDSLRRPNGSEDGAPQRDETEETKMPQISPFSTIDVPKSPSM